MRLVRITNADRLYEYVNPEEVQRIIPHSFKSSTIILKDGEQIYCPSTSADVLSQAIMCEDVLVAKPDGY